MKFLILLAAIVVLGIILVFTAIQFQQPSEIQADLTEPETTQQPAEEPESVEVIATVQETTEETVEEIPEETLSATESACLALEERYMEDLEDAEQEMNRKLNDFERADDRFDDYLSADNRDEARVDELRANKQIADDEYEEAKKEFNGTKKRLNRAREECGLR